MNIFSEIPKYQLYLLQLENYELGRFWKLLFKRGIFPKPNLRKSLVWTKKAILIFVLAEILIFGLAIFKGWYFYNHFAANKLLAAAVFLLAVFILKIFSFVFFSLATLLVWPFDFLAKSWIVFRAKSKIKEISKGLKIIGIAGSYGKTTMKEVLGQVLSIKYQVSSTPESVNTPVGIGRWVLEKVDASTEIIIVEMGEHYVGDIAELCKITPPDVAVVTGINEAHLERMKTMGNITATIFEVASNAKPGATIVLNGDDENVVGNYKKFAWPDQRVEKFSAKGASLPGRQGSASGGQISNFKFQKFNAENLKWEAEAEGLGKVEINLLGEYALADVDAAIKVAHSLGMNNEEIKSGIAQIKPVEHRLQPIKSASNVLVIDDSYNGNPAGAEEAIKVLSKFDNRRKIYITPGLVETGSSAPGIHRKIGEQLASTADVVILIRNSVTPWIEEGIRQKATGNRGVVARRSASDPFGKAQGRLEPSRDGDEAISSEKEKIASDALAMTEIIWFNTAPEAHAALPQILKPGDVILFQNDWGDQYI